MTQHHPTPAQFAAIRALDDVRMWQFMVLLEDFGWRVGLAWVAMCHGWRNDRIVDTNRNPRLEPGETETFQAAAWGKQSTGTYRTPVIAQPHAPRKRSTVH